MIKAKVIAKTTVHNVPRALGDIVEVDHHTFRNLAAKGRLEEAAEDAEVSPEPSEEAPKKTGKGKAKSAAPDA